MHNGNPRLTGFIRETIRQNGPVTFAWFMERALYDPRHGYYGSGRARIGRRGDYFTSVSVGPLFGQLLAMQFSEMWEILGRPHDFRIVEQGAHGGEFAGDVLAALRRNHGDFFRAITYEIVEPFVVWQTRQAKTLAEFGPKVHWQKSMAELAPFRGVHFSNELLDGFPVHLVKWTGTEWLERHLDAVEEGFVLVDLPLSDSRIGDRLQRIAQLLPVGYETEVNLAVLDWIDAVARKLTVGWILAADYGYTRDEFYAVDRTKGTLRCYSGHRVLPSPLLQVGQADVTAHVDWTSVAEQAFASGLSVAGFADQHHFITGLLASDMGRELASAADEKTQRALQTLLHPGLLGMKFQFLALARNVPADVRLLGMQFGRTAPGN